MNENEIQEKTERNSSVELLRLLAGIGVVILHYNFIPGGGGAAEHSSGGSYILLMFLEMVCCVAVNAFILITGYFNCEKKEVSYIKLWELVVQLICFNLVIYILRGLAGKIQGGGYHVTIKGVLGACLPVNYYVVLYVVLCLLSPYINIILGALDAVQLRFFTMLIFVLFSVYATGVDVIKEFTGKELSGLSSVGIGGSMAGYSIVNFVMMYIFGAFIRKGKLGEKVKTKKLLVVYFISIVVVWAWHIILPGTAWTYCNPFLIVESCCVFIFFLKCKFYSRVVNILAPAAYTSFLLHGVLIRRIDYASLEDKSMLYVMLHLGVTVACVYIICWAVYFIWKRVTVTMRIGLKKVIDKWQGRNI